MRPKIYAHRGGRKWAPENTLAAFQKSVQFNVDGVELDVHKCKTGELVVIHGGILGGDLSHTTNGAGLVKDLSFDEIRKFSAGSSFSPRFEKQRVPLLREVFDVINGRCEINIELKNAPYSYDGIEEDLVREIRAYVKPETIIVSSFDHKSLAKLHALMPGLRLGLLIDGLLVDIADYARKIGFTSWHPYLGELRPDYMREAKDAGLAVIAWTANDPTEWDLALSLKVDGIVTDDPVGLRRYLDKKLGRE